MLGQLLLLQVGKLRLNRPKSCVTATEPPSARARLELRLSAPGSGRFPPQCSAQPAVPVWRTALTQGQPRAGEPFYTTSAWEQ